MKSGVAHAVPLADAAVRTLDAARGLDCERFVAIVRRRASVIQGTAAISSTTSSGCSSPRKAFTTNR